MKSFLSVLFTCVLSVISSSAFAYDVRYKNQLLEEEILRVSLKTHFNLDLATLDVGGGTLQVTLPGKIYGLREVTCALLPIENGRKHVALNCQNDFGGFEAKYLEGQIFSVHSDRRGGLLFSDYAIYGEARRLLGVRIKNAKVIQSSKPIVRIQAGSDEAFECSLDVQDGAVNFELCVPKLEASENLGGKEIPSPFELLPVLGK